MIIESSTKLECKNNKKKRFSVERKLHAPLIPPRIQSGTPRAAYYAAVFLLSFLPSKTFRFNDDKRLLQETLDRR